MAISTSSAGSVRIAVTLCAAAVLAACGARGGDARGAAPPAPATPSAAVTTAMTGTAAAPEPNAQTSQDITDLQNQINSIDGDTSSAQSALASPEGDPTR